MFELNELMIEVNERMIQIIKTMIEINDLMIKINELMIEMTRAECLFRCPCVERPDVCVRNALCPSAGCFTMRCHCLR